MNWTRRMTTSAVVALCLGTTLTMSAQAQGPLTADAPKDLTTAAAAVTPLTEAQRQDITTYATGNNVSVAAAIANFEYQDDFQRVVDLLEDKFPDQFSDSTFQGLDGTPASIAFKGAAPALAQELVNQLPIPVRIISGRGLSVSELNPLTTSMLGALLDTYDPKSANLSIDPATLAVDVEYEGTTPLDSAAVGEKLREAARASTPGAALLKFTVTQVDRPASYPALLSGGTQLTYPAGGNACTAGFTVRNISTGQTGMLTAGHCPDNMRYEGRTEKYFTFAGNTFANETDAQWHVSNDSVWNQFISNESNGSPILRKATSVSGVSVGSAICKFGQRTKGGCTTVRALYHATTAYNDTTNTDMPIQTFMTENHIIIEGDSGGPWFFGNAAQGILFGYWWSSGSYRDLPTRITQIQGVSNLRVLLQ